MSRQYNNQPMPMHPQDQQHPPRSMQPPASPPIPIDPALALYPPSYYPYHTQQHPQVSQQLSMVPGLSSPSSQASDTMSTPPTEQMSFSGSNKRPTSSSTLDNDNDNFKRRKEDDSATPPADGGEPKTKPTRGSRSLKVFFITANSQLTSRRACTVCRRLKMKCEGAEQGPPCKRCITGNHECIFEESNRGKRTSKYALFLKKNYSTNERLASVPENMSF